MHASGKQERQASTLLLLFSLLLPLLRLLRPPRRKQCCARLAVPALPPVGCCTGSAAVPHRAAGAVQGWGGDGWWGQGVGEHCSHGM